MKKNFSTERVSDEYLELNSCGIEKFSERDGICNRPYGRTDYQVIYVAEGVCSITENGSVKKAPCGSVVFYPPGTPQRYSFYKDDKSVSYYMHFTGSGCERIFKKLGIFRERTEYIGKNAFFEEIFEKMFREYSIKLPGYEEYCAGLLMELFSTVSRYERIRKTGTRMEAVVMEACRKICEQLNSVTPAALASDAYMSVGHFSHMFRDVTGKSPQVYITDMKIAKAKDMLANTNFPISHVAFDSGYSDQNYFSRIFKRKTGVSPNQFRQHTASAQ